MCNMQLQLYGYIAYMYIHYIYRYIPYSNLLLICITLCSMFTLTQLVDVCIQQLDLYAHGVVPPSYGYPPQQSRNPHQQEGYFPVTQYPLQPQHSTNVVVVQQGPASIQQTTIIEHEREVNHCLHCIISVFCFPWILVWCCLCCIYGC